MQLRFHLHSDAPSEYRQAWNALKATCESGERDTLYLVQAWGQILADNHVGTDTERQLLHRTEGGIGGDNNVTDRQIRFSEERYFAKLQKRKVATDFDDIALDACDSSNGMQRWTVEELLQFGRALKAVFCNEVQGGDCVTLAVTVEDQEDHIMS